MEKNTNRLFAGFLALSCAFVLGACDPITATPSSYKEPILLNEDGTPVSTNDNVMGKIYDTISSNKNDTTLQLILSELADQKYGSYDKIMAAYNSNSNSQIMEYVNSHKEVFVRENDTQELQIARFKQFAEDIKNRVSETFYALITSGSYNDESTGRFDEEKLYTKLSEELWDLQPAPTTWKKFYVTSELTKENALDHLTKELYSYPESQAVAGLPEGVEYKARGYIEKKVFPQVLKDKLVEEYIYNNEYSSLGRSYARKVNYVKVPYTSKSLSYVDYVTKNFVNEFVYKPYTNEADEELKFDFIDKAIIGFEKINDKAGQDVGSTQYPLITLTSSGGTYVPYSGDYITYSNAVNKSYYESLNGKQNQLPMVEVKALTNSKDYTTNSGMPIFDQDFQVYPNTKLGELLDSYNKALRARDNGLLATDDDMTEYEKFSNGESLADVLKNKIISLAKEDNTVNGWFVKNGGITELPSALRDRLFKTNVAADFEDGYILETAADRTIGKYRYVDGDPSKTMIDRVPFVRNIENRKFIMSANAEKFDTNNDNFIYTDGSSFYICQVLEAVSTSKLDVDNNKAYKNGDTVDVMKIENFARQIAKVLSTKDTYITNAYTKYLEKYGFEFYDSSLYDYFKGQYPDLFDDED